MNIPFEQIFERSPVAKIIVDKSGIIRVANENAEKLFGYERSELVGNSVEMLVPEEHRGSHPALLKKYASDPTPKLMGQGRDLYGVRRDRERIPIEVGLNPVELDGEVLFMACVIDITERKRADEKFRAVVESAPNGILMIDSSGQIVLCNKQVEEIFGYDHGELIDRPIEMLVPDDFKAPHPNFVKSFFKAPETRTMGIGRELFGRHKSGRLVPVEVGLRPFYGSEGIFVISSVVDISFRRNAQAEIQRKTEEIEEFAYRTSHDLRSPLKSISALSECVVADIQDGESSQAVKGAEQIRQLSCKLIQLTEDILALTKVDAESVEFREFDFEECEQTVRDKFQADLEETQTRVEFQLFHSSPLLIQGARLIHVIDNLISNAIKYRDVTRDSRVWVRTFSRPGMSGEAGSFFLQVEDNGMGIPSEKQAEAFEMFRRFHSSQIPGSGLGLYIVKKQVAKLEGQITFQSSADGTVFTLELPIQMADSRPETDSEFGESMARQSVPISSSQP